MNSPLISSVLSPQISAFSNGQEISSTNPVVVNGVKGVQIIVQFLSPYQIMEVHLRTTKNLQHFFGRLGDDTAQMNGVIISSSTDTYVEYVVNFVSTSPLPVNQLSLTFVTSDTGTTSITSLTIMACIGKIISNNPYINKKISILFIRSNFMTFCIFYHS